MLKYVPPLRSFEVVGCDRNNRTKIHRHSLLLLLLPDDDGGAVGCFTCCCCFFWEYVLVS